MLSLWTRESSAYRAPKAPFDGVPAHRARRSSHARCFRAPHAFGAASGCARCRCARRGHDDGRCVPVMKPSVVVLDYGSGTLRSAERALDRAGAHVTVTADTKAARDADALVVPGVGAFAACMNGVRAVGADVVVRERLRGERPVLGICVGMQVLYAKGEEHGVTTDGIGVLSGTVTHLDAPIVPHMGWNTIEPPE